MSLPRLAVTYDEQTDTLTVEGVSFSGGFFRVFANPHPDQLYAIHRAGAVVTVSVLREDAVWDWLMARMTR